MSTQSFQPLESLEVMPLSVIPVIPVYPMPDAPDSSWPVVHAVPIPPDGQVDDPPDDPPDAPPDAPPAAKKSKPNSLQVAIMKGKLNLLRHQYGPALAVKAHFEKPSTVAGSVLVYYQVGTGKTFSAFHAARTFIDIQTEKRQTGHVYIITTKANIDSTWTRDWDTYKSALNEEAPSASAPYTRALDWATKDAIFKKTLKTPYMLIIDEAHLLRNLDSKSASQVLDICANAAYVMPLTATPIVRTVDNLNALYSYMTGEEDRVIQMATTEDGDDATTSIETGQYFNGMVLYQAQDTSRYPTVIETVEEVPLGNEYEIFIKEDASKLKELQDKLKKHRIGKEKWDTTIARIGALGKEDAVPNPFHVNSRRVCNSIAKFQGIWDAIVADADTRVVVFSNFLDEGIVGLMNWLKQTHKFNETGKRDYKYIIRKDAGGPTYEVVLWNVKHFDEITAWQHKVDDICKILLISPSGREGLSLKGVRQFHLMEPSWNISDETQAIGRAVRMTSHTHLPPSEQNVHVRRWIATYEGGRTSDEQIKDLAKKRANVMKPYLQRLQWVGTRYLDRLVERLDM